MAGGSSPAELDIGPARPSGGTLTAFEPPKGDGIRTDSYGYAGYRTSPRFDSLLAKLIVHETTDGLNGVIQRAERALGEFRIEGVATNVPFLQSLLRHPEFRAGNGHTRFIEDHIGDLVTHDGAAGPMSSFRTWLTVRYQDSVDTLFCRGMGV